MRGICQGLVELVVGNSIFVTNEHEVNSRGETVFCYADADYCSEDFACSLPGPRHGHATTSFLLEGSSTILLHFGGETTDLYDELPMLSRDLYMGYFSLTGVVFTKAAVQDIYGDLCVDFEQCEFSLCPCERRDAAIAVIDNSGSNNGRLLMFGGMSASYSSSSPLLQYLERSTSSDIVSMDDLWYLDLEPVTQSCAQDGVCELLTWVKVDVPGQKPPGRWGAGLVADAFDNLFIMVSSPSIER
jgi:hypothetical protein